jgi:hypothetical protein
VRGREGTSLGQFPEVVDVLMASLPETAKGCEGQLEGRGRRFPLGGQGIGTSPSPGNPGERQNCPRGAGSGDWHFGYRVEDGYWGFLEIIGEDEGNRARRKPGKDLYGTVTKYGDRKGNDR